MERSEQKVVPHFRLLVSEHSCRYYNILSDRVLFLTEISVVLSILLPKFIDWVLIMKWSNDSLWLMSYGKYFDHEMVEWYHMENILTMRWSNDFIRHLPYNETWSLSYVGLKLQEKIFLFAICKKYIKKIKISCLITNLTEPKIT